MEKHLTISDRHKSTSPPDRRDEFEISAITATLRFVEVQRLGADGFEELGKFGTALSGFEDE